MRTILSVALFGLFFSTVGKAEENEPATENNYRPEWRLMLGVDAGLGLLSTSVANEGGKSGIAGNGKVILGYYRDLISFDASLGALYHNLNRTDSVGTHYSVESLAFLAEVGARYRIMPRWYLGPVVSWALGSDLSFRETANPQVPVTGGQSSLFLVGLQGLYDIPAESYRMQAGLRASTDINLSNRQLVLIQGVFQIGIPLFESAEPPKAEAAPVEKKVEQKVEVVVPTEKMVTHLDLGVINFDTNSTELTEASRQYLIAVGRLLARKPGELHGIEIDGHTDKRGSLKLNLALSQGRADAVKKAIVEGGVKPDKVKTKGYGPNRPLDARETAEAYSKNRRVDFKLIGAVYPEQIQTELQEMQEKKSGVKED